MNSSKLVRLSAASAVLLASFGCHRPTPEQIATQTAENAAALITEAGETAQSANGMTALNTTSAAVRTAAGSPCLATDPACAAPMPPPQDAFDAQVAQIRKFLRERIFIADNLESSDALSATFLVPGTAICSDGTYDPDPACVAQVDAAELRVKAWPQLGGGVNLQVLVSPDRFELASFELGKQSLAVIADLPQSKKAMDFIATASGATATPTPKVLEGKVEARLTRNGDHDFTVSYGVPGAVKVTWTDATGKESTFSTASSNPLASLRMEAAKKRATVELNVGETKYVSPFFDGANPGNPNNGTPQTYFLSGLTGKLVAEEGQDVRLTNVGLGGGQSYLEVGQLKLSSIDLNKDSWRHLDVKVQRDATDHVVLVMTPELDVIAGFFYTAMEHLGMVVPQGAQDMTLRWRLNGSSAPAMTALPANADTGFPGGWKILSGTLTISTSLAGVDPVVVPEGQCLVSGSSIPFLGGGAAAACPQ